MNYATYEFWWIRSDSELWALFSYNEKRYFEQLQISTLIVTVKIAYTVSWNVDVVSLIPYGVCVACWRKECLFWNQIFIEKIDFVLDYDL